MNNIDLYTSHIVVNINNLIDNILYLKSKINASTLFMAVIKANAYGHGIDIINYIDNIVDYYGVANILEALEVRKLTSKAILILGNSFEDSFIQAYNNNIILTIGSLENFLIYKKFYEKHNIVLKTHLKVDTGMGRVGILPNEIDYIINEINRTKCVDLLGVFTHLAEAENSDKTFTLKQIDIFKNLKSKIQKHFNNLIFHCANSSAILNHKNVEFDMIRIGLAMYGIGIPEDDNLKQVMTLKSKIVSIKELPENHYVGYNLMFKTKNKTKIGIIPLGYADGISRIFSNNLEVLINGVRCPVIGNISMDQMTIDISNVKNVSIGTEVILINKEIPIKEWSLRSNKIPYEILCNFGNRIKRVYFLK
ncbi:MAG: alanine racemase [Candidatus Sericytochromatia bacterium]|nr:MAG: alanine racemase [Candidatus Sericytochromatia bacterium]